MNLSAPLQHAGLVQGMWRAAAHGRLSHALLLEGPSGIGKFMAARWLAAGLLCTKGPLVEPQRYLDLQDGLRGVPCGACPACKKMGSGSWRGNHPDCLVIDPEEEGLREIGVGRIAARAQDGDEQGADPCLNDFLSLRPSESEVRCVLLRAAERLNLHAQNALLKTLEEPAPFTYLILECSRPAALLPTIKSRLVRILLQRLTDRDCSAVLADLAELDGCDPKTRALLGSLSQGAPGEARSLHRRAAPEMLELLFCWLSGARSPWDTARALWEVHGEFPGQTALAQERERVASVLVLLCLCYRQALAMSIDVNAAAGDTAGRADLDSLHGVGLETPQQVQPASTSPIHPTLRKLAASMGEAGLCQALEALIELQADLRRNLDPGLILDRALLRRAVVRGGLSSSALHSQANGPDGFY